MATAQPAYSTSEPAAPAMPDAKTIADTTAT